MAVSLAIMVSLTLVTAGGMVPAPSAASALAPSAFSPGHPLTPSTQPAALKPSVDSVQVGLSGEIKTDIVVMELTREEKAVLLGTSRGVYIISQGTLLNYIPTPSSVVEVALLDDVTRDGQQDIVLAVWDTYFPNIRCHNGDTGDKVWQFIPKQEVFIDNLMWTEQQTLTFDIEALDINSDNVKDVIATSGYRVYAIDGSNGNQIWNFEATNNLWKIAVTADINIDGTPDLAVGGQNGFMHILSSKDGKVLWQGRIAEKCEVIDNTGKVWATVDYSIWGIVAIGGRGKPQAVVSSEDGKVRLVNLTDGTIEWETPVIEYVKALQYDYYRHKQQKPTSPGDLSFFNLRVCLVPDVTGDGIEEILASTYTGQGGEEGEGLGRSGLFLINGASGLVLWQKIGLSLGNISRVEIVSIGEEQVILLPQGKSGFTDEVDVIDLESGTALETIEIESGPESTGGNKYTVKDFGNDTFILASDYGDLLWVSPEGEVLWDYPRVTDIAVERGEFCGDETEDLLIRSRTYPYGKQDASPVARVLYVMDGATRTKVWSYEIAYEEFVTTGGISGVQITPDLNGDGKQDIAGFIQSPEEQARENFGEDSRIILLSGKDGTILLKQPVVTETYYGIWDEFYKDPSSLKPWLSKHLHEEELLKQLEEWQERLEREEKNRRVNKCILSFGVAQFREGGPAPICLVVRTPYELYLLSPQGDTLLTWTFEPWHYQEPFSEESEFPPGVKLGLPKEHWNRQLVLDDLNGDGGDDMAIFTHQEIYISTTEIDIQTGDLDLKPYRTIEVEEGIDWNQGWLGDDLDGDGIREVFYFRHQENRPQMLTFVSPVTGKKLLEMEYEPHRYTLDLGCADFDGDGYADTLLFQRWVEGKEGPKVEVRSGWDKAIIWEFNDYRADHLFHRMNYQSGAMPACPISDISGDSITDLALIKNLTWQPGAQIVLYDAAQDREVKNIVLEEIDPTRHRDLRWHPGLLVKEITDVNGDGSKELVAVIALGDTDTEKEWQLMVVDIRNDELLADFRVIGSDFIELGQGSEFGMTGLSGEVCLLDIASDLRIIFPTEGSTQTSPVTVEWTGIGEGAFNQVFVDGVEVGRTNENEFTVPIAQGEHRLEIRSLDEYGRGVYRTVRFDVKKSSASLIQVILWLVLFFIIALVPTVLGFIIRYRRRRTRRG